MKRLTVYICMNLIGVFIAFTSVHITSYSTISYDNINYISGNEIVATKTVYIN